MKKPKSIVILGRRWFQKTYGNTYHTATVIIDGETMFSTPIEYGYGDQYRDTAFRELESRGLIPARLEHANGSHECSWQWEERTGIKVGYSCADVMREKDL